MKKINLKAVFFIILILLMSPSALSQFKPIKTNFGIGYNVGTHLSAGGLDFVIGRYNETRPSLTSKMKEPRFFNGINLATDFYFIKGLFNLEFVARSSTVFAQSPDGSGANSRRDLIYRANSLNWGYGAKIKTKKVGVIGPYAGMDFSTISTNTATREYSTGSSKTKYETINWNLQIGISPFVSYVSDRLNVKLYFQYMLLKSQFKYENKLLNPNTWADDEYSDSEGKTTSIGISIRYNLKENTKAK